MYGTLFQIILADTAVIIFSVIFLKKIIKREFLLKPVGAPATFEKVEDVILKIIVGALLVYYIYGSIIPIIQDIPNIIQDNYNIVEGISQKSTVSSRLGDVGVYIKDNQTQEIVKVGFKFRSGIEKGDSLTVQYLPHSKRGFLVERNGVKYSRTLRDQIYIKLFIYILPFMILVAFSCIGAFIKRKRLKRERGLDGDERIKWNG